MLDDVIGDRDQHAERRESTVQNGVSTPTNPWKTAASHVLQSAPFPPTGAARRTPGGGANQLAGCFQLSGTHRRQRGELPLLRKGIEHLNRALCSRHPLCPLTPDLLHTQSTPGNAHLLSLAFDSALFPRPQEVLPGRPRPSHVPTLFSRSLLWSLGYHPLSPHVVLPPQLL